jgi:threonine synthase
MKHIKNLRCLICGREYRPDEVQYICPHHGNEGILDVQYDYNGIAASFSRKDLERIHEPTIWRYKPLLPIQPNSPVPPLRVGGTPLYNAQRLATILGVHHLWIKDDTRQPTGSLKDRASAVAIVKAYETGAKIITTASTGNAAAALSGLCASVNQPNVIFVPASAPEAKVAQLLVFGSTVLLVEGTYDDAFDLCLEAAQEYGWYNRNTAYNPYMTEGKKTVAYEILEQLEWQSPDVIFIPVGDGCIIGGVHKGLKDLIALGWIEKIPRLIGVQASGSSSLYDAWEKGIPPTEIRLIRTNTIADSIAAGLPRDRIKAMRAVRETHGAFVIVNDEEILKAIPALARGSGVFAEPAGAASLAGMIKAISKSLVAPDERIVILVTGSGLKDIRATLQAVEKPKRIKPNLKAVKAALQGQG